MFRLLPSAERDIESIALRIAADNPAAALRWWDQCLDICRRIGDMPGIGKLRPEIRPELRTFAFGRYLILYRRMDRDAEIVRVVHGAHDWQQLLK